MLTILVLALGLMVWPAKVIEAAPMGTAFTYQGRLIDANNPADGEYDFQFKLYDDANTITGNQLGDAIDINELNVIDGYFTVELNFGSGIFTGNARWLEIGVRPGDSTGGFTTLSPRQEVTPTPYAIYAAYGPEVEAPLTLSGSSSEPIIKATNTGSGYGVHGEAWGKGVYGETLGSYGWGVYGYAPYSSSQGVYGYATGNYGTGVYGKATWSNGIGVCGEGGQYDFYATGIGTTPYGTASSVRWKSDIRPIDDPLEKILRLRGVYFNWDAEHGGEHDVGMVAEEVGEVLPEIVGYEENGIDATGMDYSKLTPLLVEAIKALKIEGDERQKELAEKEVEIVELKARLAALETCVDRRQMTDDRGQRTDDRGQRTDDRRQRTDDR